MSYIVFQNESYAVFEGIQGIQGIVSAIRCNEHLDECTHVLSYTGVFLGSILLL